MFPEEVFKERQEFAAKIAEAPPDYLKDNAAALLRIIWEMQASLALELQVIQGIKRLDVTDAAVVSSYLERFSDYTDRRDFNLERTSCRRIANIYHNQIRILEGGSGGAQRAPELDQLLGQFAHADQQFTEAIEPFMDRTRVTLIGICDAATANRIEDARALQDEFAEAYRVEVQRLKSTINEMSEVGCSLLERL